MEPFAVIIRKDPHICGLQLPISTCTEECHISQYGDDSKITVRSYPSMHKVFLISELYCLASGAKINKDKSCGMWLGQWCGNRDRPVDIEWLSDIRKYYGIYLGNSDYLTYNHNVFFSKFCKSIDSLKIRGLDMYSRVKVDNMYTTSKLWYVLPVLPFMKNTVSR